MNEASWFLIGVTGALFTTFGFVPQVVKMWRTKSVSDISPLTFIQFIIGVSLWSVYGFHIGDPVVVSANVVALCVLSIGIFLYIRYSGRSTRRHT